MISAFAALFLLISVGLLVRVAVGVQRADAMRKAINDLVYVLLLPLLAFSVVSPIHPDAGILAIPVVPGITVTVCAALAWLIYSRRTTLSRGTTGSLILAAAWGNVTYLGYPFIKFVIGDHVQHIPLLYDMTGNTPMLLTLGIAICMYYGSDTTKFTPSAAFISIIRTPAFIGVMLGLLAAGTGLELPELVTVPIALAGEAVAPLMLITIGLGLRPPTTRQLRTLGPAIIIKLIISPALGFVLISFLGFSTDVSAAMLFESAMPVMMLPLVFAEHYGLDEEIMAQAIVISTTGSLVTLPVVQWIM
ncbi:MAG: AEC family transporter [Chlorobi bacterium]|nr:MAG: AEC family transporter [Bacteroidota bacterium]KXK32620.1 MAG: Membrane transport protein [Chlorobi bacterium OLB6]MBE2265481.1 AEC family transporter [Flavobacteriales bacterium]MBL1162207.1 AEC family transporter [Chlorobiota bacterium]MBW7854418.1 AEC family transporter [Candidatus Kapabacteria bacterium]MCC6331688.1 AEC family transporter [Ignavibacteria bacterium]